MTSHYIKQILQTAKSNKPTPLVQQLLDSESLSTYVLKEVLLSATFSAMATVLVLYAHLDGPFITDEERQECIVQCNKNLDAFASFCDRFAK